jgi:toxin ParE1/3/4
VKPKPLRLRPRADRDINEAVDYYLREGTERAALGFIDDLARALRRIERNPGIGSTRYALELGLVDLRTWPLRRYPHVVFYVGLEDHVDVWRVLRGHRGVPAWMTKR